MNLFEMVNAFLPTLSSFPGLSDRIVFAAGATQTALILITQKRSEQASEALKSEFQLLSADYTANKIKLDEKYVQSDSLEANLVQILRAFEVAESERKIRYISRAFAGCFVDFGAVKINKTLCLRIIEQMTIEEIDYLANIMSNKRFARGPRYRPIDGIFADSEETEHLNRGLFQLGLLEDMSSGWGNNPGWRPSVLAEHITILSRTIPHKD